MVSTYDMALALVDSSKRAISDEVWQLAEMGASFIAPGGVDIDPKLYDQENIYSRVYHPEVDLAEARVVENILDCAKVLGTKLIAICRGHQLLGVVLGVPLIQDIMAETGQFHSHSQVKLTSKRMADILKVQVGLIEANSLHHQALASVPAGWSTAARWGGIIEAIESEDYPSIVSFQWHPEMISTQMRRLEEWLNAGNTVQQVQS